MTVISLCLSFCGVCLLTGQGPRCCGETTSVSRLHELVHDASYHCCANHALYLRVFMGKGRGYGNVTSDTLQRMKVGSRLLTDTRFYLILE